MRSTSRHEAAKAIGWLLVGLTVLPLLAAQAQACESVEPAGRLAQLLTLHDARELMYVAPAVKIERAVSAEESKR